MRITNVTTGDMRRTTYCDIWKGWKKGNFKNCLRNLVKHFMTNQVTFNITCCESTNAVQCDQASPANMADSFLG